MTRIIKNYGIINIKKLFSLMIILSPITRQYVSGIPGINLADVILFFVTLLILLKFRKGYNKYKIKPLILFWFFGLLLSLISTMLQQSISSDMITRFIRFSFYIYLVIISTSYFEVDYALNKYKILSIITSVYIFMQFSVFNLFSYLLTFKILPIPLIRDITVEHIEALASQHYLRATGFFVEPAYAAQFLLPSLVLFLFGWQKYKLKKNIKLAAFTYVSIVLTTSAQGIFLGGVIIGLYMLHEIKNTKKESDVIKHFFMIITILFIAYVSFNFQNIQIAIYKVTSEVRPGSSTALRIFRGFSVYSQIPIVYKIVGIGHGNLANFVFSKSIFTPYDPIIMNYTAADYANGISRVLLYYGGIGLVFFTNIYYHLIKNNRGAMRILAVIHFIMMFVDGGFFNLVMVFYYSFIYNGFFEDKVLRS